MSQSCTHLDQILVAATPAASCASCVQLGMQWVHLRRCLACGHVGCCDSSPGRHASAHFRQTGHPVMASAQPGEDWRWCYVDQAYV